MVLRMEKPAPKRGAERVRTRRPVSLGSQWALDVGQSGLRPAATATLLGPRGRVGCKGPAEPGLPGPALTVRMFRFFSRRAFVHFTNALVTALTASR